MAIVGAGGGNDVVLQSLYRYLAKGHDVTVFTSSKPLKDFSMKIKQTANIRLPVFGLFRQLIPVYHKEIPAQDLIIVLTGNPPKSKVKTVYYHQQMPSHAGRDVPDKYRRGAWRLYYSLFKLAKRLSRPNESTVHYCVSNHLRDQLEQVGIFARTVYPSVERTPAAEKEGCVMTVCRLSPEKNLEDNLAALTGFAYNIYGSTNPFTNGYLKRLQSSLYDGQRIHADKPRAEILEALGRASVYYSSSKETLGLAVLESIAAGCIPIVIDNSANKETVPFSDLRFDTFERARELVRKATSGEFDHLKPMLAKHLERFTDANYEELLKR